ncbi:MAG: aminoglycoside phosphotransferase family protein [Methylobacterium mesophilicum]|nr:aminoglycoside phosphotransferase family protein [Methylobacterium mesophilicum]
MHADELDIDAALVRRLLVEQFPRWADLPLKRVASSGTDNAIFRLGSEMLVRLPRIERVAGSIEHERKCLLRLAPFLPVAVSTPLAKGSPTDFYPCDWAVYDWLKGENPVVGSIVDPGGLASDLAGFIHAFWRIDPTDGPPKKQTLIMRDEQVQKDFRALENRIDLEIARLVWRDALKLPHWSATPVWVHGDLAPGNLLLADHRLVGVIDFSGAGVGDPSVDMQLAWNLLPANARPIFRKKVGADDATWLRARARSLAQALVQLPYYWNTNRVLAANARHVIAEISAEARDEFR